MKVGHFRERFGIKMTMLDEMSSTTIEILPQAVYLATREVWVALF